MFTTIMYIMHANEKQNNLTNTCRRKGVDVYTCSLYYRTNTQETKKRQETLEYKDLTCDH